MKKEIVAQFFRYPQYVCTVCICCAYCNMEQNKKQVFDSHASSFQAMNSLSIIQYTTKAENAKKCLQNGQNMIYCDYLYHGTFCQHPLE